MAGVSEREALGRAVRASRVEKGMSQEVLAESAGIQRPTLSAIECGSSDARVQTVFRLAEALDMQPSQIIARAESIIASAR